MKVTLFDYGAGNLHSLKRAIESLGHTTSCETNARLLGQETDLLVLPGVGAFGHAARKLAPGREEVRVLLQQGLPCVGICLGMQLLFENSEEDGFSSEGLSVFSGSVRKLGTSRVPHMGWEKVSPDRAVAQVPMPSSSYLYFAHSYVCCPQDESVVALSATAFGQAFPAVVRKGAVIGVQCHPEKSSKAGVAWLGDLFREVTR